MNRVLRSFPGLPAAALAAAALAAITVSAAEPQGRATGGPIRAEAAWARASPGAASTGAAYVRILNTGANADRLIAASAPVARRVELHTHRMSDGVLRMRRIAALPIGPRGAVTLEPGGHHLMLIGLHAPLQRGGRFPLTLSFEKAGAVTVSVRIAGVGARGPDD